MVDNQVVEVYWDEASDAWKLVRVRDDKQFPNHKKVVIRTMPQIHAGLSLEEVSSSLVHAARKLRPFVVT